MVGMSSSSSSSSSSTRAAYTDSLIPLSLSLSSSRHCWISKDKLIGEVLHGHSNPGQLAKIYIYRLCADTGYRLEDFTMGAG